MATAMSTAGETMWASTAALPTTSPPKMETVAPMGLGRRSPASWSTSKARSMMSTSNTVEKGTSCLAATMDRASFTGMASGWKVTRAIYSPGTRMVTKAQNHRITFRAEAAIQWKARSWPVLKNWSMVPGSIQAKGSPSAISPTRPSSRAWQNRSGRWV